MTDSTRPRPEARCAGIKINSAKNEGKEHPCTTKPKWIMRIRGIAVVEFLVCDEHFDKARRALEGDTREWSARPINEQENT